MESHWSPLARENSRIDTARGSRDPACGRCAIIPGMAVPQRESDPKAVHRANPRFSVWPRFIGDHLCGGGDSKGHAPAKKDDFTEITVTWK